MRALASVDLAAIERNIGLLAAAAPSAQLCAVVKGDGYGHGATEVAAAAIRAGATWLA
ncbi:MAG: alanine racemase, partial [Solirubrobacteraceae bacterium]|nr:alanine racemase [Solirubrobacteraceae bacterium]